MMLFHFQSSPFCYFALSTSSALKCTLQTSFLCGAFSCAKAPVKSNICIRSWSEARLPWVATSPLQNAERAAFHAKVLIRFSDVRDVQQQKPIHSVTHAMHTHTHTHYLRAFGVRLLCVNRRRRHTLANTNSRFASTQSEAKPISTQSHFWRHAVHHLSTHGRRDIERSCV